MNISDPQTPESLAAVQLIERFLNRFGQSVSVGAGYRELARHAALPFLLTPELLNLLRGEFLADSVDWVAEADLLLSELCQEVGYEQFAMRLDARAMLLGEAESELGEARLEAIARRVLAWVAGQASEGSGFRHYDLQTQQWGAMVYLKEKRHEAAREMADALHSVTTFEGRQAAVSVAADAEAMRLSNVILQLRDRLRDYPELIEQAEVTTRLLLQSGTLRAAAKSASTAAKSSSTFPPTVPLTFQTIRLDARGKEISRVPKQARQFEEDLGDGLKLAMVEIPGGKFMMGAPKSEQGSYDNERPQHEVTISPFYIGKFTVTQAQWRAVAALPKIEIELKPNPSHFKGDNRPVEQVNLHEAREFCARLANHTGRLYRLPSEAEWEYACRAGTTTPFAFGETITNKVVNYYSENPYGNGPKEKSRGETIEVGSLGVANDFGLFDMHGNVWEWCEDHWHNSYEGAPIDGSAWLSGKDSSRRVVRGGSWNDFGYNCRSAGRLDVDPGYRNYSLGFRVVVAARSS